MRQQFRMNMHEEDEAKILAHKEAAMRALGNFYFQEAERMARVSAACSAARVACVWGVCVEGVCVCVGGRWAGGSSFSSKIGAHGQVQCVLPALLCSGLMEVAGVERRRMRHCGGGGATMARPQRCQLCL